MNMRTSARLLAVGLVALTGVAALAYQPAGGGGGGGGGQPPAGERPARGPGGGQPGGPGGPGGGGGRQVNVEGAMKQMNGALRRLSAQIGDASKNEENLRLLNDMQRGCAGAKGAPFPEDKLGGAKDDAAKAKVMNAFRADLINVMRLLLDAEQAIMDGKNDVAKSKLDEVVKLKDSGHKRMGVD